MATLVIHPGTHEMPAEYQNTRPISCAQCGADWDEDDDAETGYEYVDTKPFCINPSAPGRTSCATIARAIAFRSQAARLVAYKLLEASEELEELEETYPNSVDDHGHPTAMIADMRRRLELFAAGKDNGFRDGVMLDYSEAIQLAEALRIPATLMLTIPSLAGSDKALALLELATKRTTEGAAQ